MKVRQRRKMKSDGKEEEELRGKYDRKKRKKIEGRSARGREGMGLRRHMLR